MPEKQTQRLIIAGAAALAIAALAKPLWAKLRLARAPVYKLKANGVEVHISAYGGIIQRLLVADKRGKVDDVVLGHDKLEAYSRSGQYFGAVVGRVCNRIAGGVLRVDGEEYSLPINDGQNHLHGGVHGWDKAVWSSRRFQHGDGDAVELKHTSKDGDEGYPGTVQASVLYVLTPAGELRVTFEATTDKTTPVSMTQHSYFNLAGHASGDVLDHVLQITASNFTPKDGSGIPSGAIVPVENTPFDFSESRRVGARIADVHGGYDHNFVLFGLGKQAKFATSLGAAAQQPKAAARLEDPKSGRVMKISTTAPGMQFYAGNAIEGVAGKDGAVYNKHAGLCLETQFTSPAVFELLDSLQGFPNAVNEPAFPSILVSPGEKYRHEVVYSFSAD